MHTGWTLFALVIKLLPRYEFQKCVTRYDGDRRVRSFTCWDQLLCLILAQLTCRESLRDIVACLRAVDGRLYHMGIRGTVPRSTLADANEARDWRIYADLAQVLIHEARHLHDVNVLDDLLPEAGAFYVMDRGYLDFGRLYR